MATIQQRVLGDKHKYEEHVSALQKAIRRADGELAAYTCYWLHLGSVMQSTGTRSGYGNGAFIRLAVIAAEDIGPAAPMATHLVLEFHKRWVAAVKTHCKKQNIPYRVGACHDCHEAALLLRDCAWQLCVLPKCRVTSYSSFWALHQIYALEVFSATPEADLRAALLNTDIYGALTAYAILYVKAAYTNDYYGLADALIAAGCNCTLVNQFSICKRTLTTQHLSLLSAIWCVLLGVESTMPLRVIRCEERPLATQQPMEAWPDFVLDKHTQAGRAMNRGLDHFMKDGVYIENAKFPELEQHWRAQGILAYTYHATHTGLDRTRKLVCRLAKTYTTLAEVTTTTTTTVVSSSKRKRSSPPIQLQLSSPYKRLQSSEVPLETDLTRHRLRAQLVVGVHNPDTYYCKFRKTIRSKEWHGVFVKGPFINEKSALAEMRADQIKQHLSGLATRNITVVYMRFVRSALPQRRLSTLEDRSVCAFLVMRDLTDRHYATEDERTAATLLKESKTFECMQVRDLLSLSKHGFGNFHPSNRDCSSKVDTEAVLAMCWRYCCAMRDNANRNLLVAYDTVYSVDETSICAHDAPLPLFLKKKLTAEQKTHYASTLPSVGQCLLTWRLELGAIPVSLMSLEEKYRFIANLDHLLTDFPTQLTSHF